MTSTPASGAAIAVKLRRGCLVALATAAVLAGFTAPAQAAAPRHSVTGGLGRTVQPVTISGVHAAAVGKLPISGCTATVGVASCDLYARAGNATVLGNPVPVWAFTSNLAVPVQPTGPTLVVAQNTTVSITLHNQLAGQNISLALPGQNAADFAGSAADDVTGVATGESRTYAFTARRAGTFLYEAGHTAMGNRQVAMGLAGALVVLPGDGTGYGAGTSYDDDAVLVLSEIDPAFNASPITFDLRNFAPKYRLINGKPYPAADPIATDQGHTVLVRYLNAGAQTHAMSVLGANQLEIAQDGHRMSYPETMTAESIQPGQTVDALVKMPTGPESKVAVYEPAEHLDNNGQKTNDALQFAFGGMLTFLDTNAPPPSADGVGPVSSHLTVSPNPSDGLADVTVTADLSDSSTGGSNVTQAEFVVDDAVSTGVGFGVAMSAAFGTVEVAGAHGTIPAISATPCTEIPAPVSLNCLDAGKHTVFVRALDSAGNWGVVGSVILNLPKTGPQTVNGAVADSPANGSADLSLSATGDDSAAEGSITAAEYFLDTAGANGTGTAMQRNRVAAIVAETASIAAATVGQLTEGLHHVLVHSKDSLGLWGPLLDIELPVDLTGPAVDAGAVGPNPSNGVLSDKGNPGNLLVSAQITDRDAGGALQSRLVDAEGFLDPTTVTGDGTPTGGTGFQLIAVDGSMDSTSESVYGTIPISQIKALADGSHHVYVRGQDAAGNWGPLFGIVLTVDKTAPVLGTLSGSPNPTNGASTLTLSAPVTDASTIAVAEYWLGTVDPGAGHASSVPVSVVNGKIVVTVPLAGVAQGAQQFNLRVADLAGNWSKPATTSVTVLRPNAIFSDTFESGNLLAWSGSTGAVANSAVAAQQVVEPGSTRGLQVSLAGGRNNRPGYLTDNSPTAEAGYHARFALDAHALTSGSTATTALTVFEARTAGNAQVFAVQFRLSAGVPQLRTVLSRSVGGVLTGAWVNLGTGSHVVQLDWTGSATGSVRLSIDGTSRQVQNGNTSTLRVDTALLGVTAGYSTTSAGIGYLDSFVSTRNTLP
jgi:FtsP/CotA-like multicopper oxidase with cupredoxin domain